MGNFRIRLLLGMCLLLVSALASAQPQTYLSTREGRGEHGPIKLQYRLELDRRDLASLTITKLDRPDLDRMDRFSFGTLLQFLESSKSVTLQGFWRNDRGRIRLDFDRVLFDKGRARVKTHLVLGEMGEQLRQRDLDREFFGRRTDLTFYQPLKGSTGNIIAAAAGALVAAAVAIGRDQKDHREWVYSGTLEAPLVIGSHGSKLIRKAELHLYADSTFVLLLSGEQGAELRGTYGTSGKDINLSITDSLLDGREPVNGDGVIRFDERGELLRLAFSLLRKVQNDYVSIQYPAP